MATTTEPVELGQDWRQWPPEAKRALLRRLRERTQQEWDDIARESQRAPAGQGWFIWLILAGRGWGKTRTGAEWAAEKGRVFPGCRVALVAQTFADGRDTMVEGESGMLMVLRDHELRGGRIDRAWNRSIGELYLANGSRFRIFSSEKPNRLRGPQHHFAWGDEPATWLDADKGTAENTTWSNLEFGLRLSTAGSEPQAVLTGTPKNVRLLTQVEPPPVGLLKRKSTVLTRGHSDENIANLARRFRDEVIEPLRGTRLGRQELAAELLDDVEGALWRRAWIDDLRATDLPYAGWQRMPVVGLDPADGTEGGAEHGLAAAGLGMDHDLYVTHSEGMRDTPTAFVKRGIEVAREVGGKLVVEKNHGGAWLVEVIERVLRDEGVRVPYETVHAAEGKRTRAEPVAALYEQGKVHHVGHFPDLEDQMCNFTGATGERSPDRLDALVWAMAKFTGLSFGPAPEPKVHEYTDGAVAGVHRWS